MRGNACALVGCLLCRMMFALCGLPCRRHSLMVSLLRNMDHPALIDRRGYLTPTRGLQASTGDPRWSDFITGDEGEQAGWIRRCVRNGIPQEQTGDRGRGTGAYFLMSSRAPAGRQGSPRPSSCKRGAVRELSMAIHRAILVFDHVVPTSFQARRPSPRRSSPFFAIPQTGGGIGVRGGVRLRNLPIPGPPNQRSSSTMSRPRKKTFSG